MMLRVSMILLATIVSTMVALSPPLPPKPPPLPYRPQGKMEDIYLKLSVF